MKTNNFLKSYHCDIVDFFFGGGGSHMHRKTGKKHQTCGESHPPSQV